MNAHVPLSEQYRLIASDWVAADAAANLLEESKSSYLAKRMAALGDMPVSRAEMQVKASEDWADYIAKMVHARERASLLKVETEFVRMQFQEWNSAEATRRSEMKL